MGGGGGDILTFYLLYQLFHVTYIYNICIVHLPMDRVNASAV